SSLGHLLVEYALGSGKRICSQPTKVSPCLQTIRIAPMLGTDDPTLAQSTVDIRRHAEVPGGVAPNIGVQVFAVVQTGEHWERSDAHSAFLNGIGVAVSS